MRTADIARPGPQPARGLARIAPKTALSILFWTLLAPVAAQQRAPEIPAELERLGVARGNPDAEIVVREFADYQCPACRSFFPIVERLLDKYVDAGQVRFVFFDFPLAMHEHAVAAAEAARCAGLQGEYWAMHEALMMNQDEWSSAQDPAARFLAYAGERGIDPAGLKRCLDSGRMRQVVMQSRKLAGEIGVRSTPTLMVGEQAFAGVVSWQRVRRAVEAELGGGGSERERAAAAEPPREDRPLEIVTSNRLADAASPYLRLHGDNPVDWYPWGEEAFAKAREEGKLVFLSIGYFTCYWCHVMERESFADSEVADILNREFVSIKVDREQRPAVDALYMRAVHVMGQRGGWPLSMFLTPDRRPFFGGTYYPKAQFIKVLEQIRSTWREEPELVEGTAAQVIDVLRRSERTAGVSEGGQVPDEELAAAAQTDLTRRFDTDNGGFGGAPKFPQPSVLQFLLDRHERTGSERALEMALVTLDAMAAGGIHDHLGGGFHRYATDTAWQVPHFEKMLYDNAQLLEVYARAWAITGQPSYREVAAGIVRYLDSTLTDPETGLLYSAQSALVHEEEGESYVWTPAQLGAALGDEQEAAVARLLYGIEGEPEVEGGHVLHRARGYEETAAMVDGLDTAGVEALHERIDAALLAARGQREQAPVGTKHVLSWNAMAIRALAYAGRVFDDPALVERARATAEAVMAHMYEAEGGPWLAVRGDYGGEVSAQLLDYAALAASLVELARATGENRWHELAARVAGDMVQRLWNPERGLFNRRQEAGDLVVATSSLRDSAVPAGNSVAAVALTALARAGYGQFAPYAATVVRAHEPVMRRQPSTLPLMLTALGAYRDAALPGRVALPEGDMAAARVAGTESATVGQEGLGLQLEGVGTGAAASRAGSLLSGEKVALRLRRSGSEGREVEVSLRIEEGWHVNAEQASLAFLVPTRLRVYRGDRELSLQTTYPEAHTIPAEALGEGPIAVYSGRVDIRAVLPASAPRETVLSAVVSVQACNDDGRCLAPDELEARIPAL